MQNKNTGAGRYGTQRNEFEKNRDWIIKTQEICGICGQPVDKRLKYPHPMSATVDHIVPVNKGGHLSAIENLQLAHWSCNRQKSDKLSTRKKIEGSKLIGNRVLPHSFDWKNFRGEG